jgi:hypothetical protein
MSINIDHRLVPPVLTNDGHCLSFLETALDYLNLILRRSDVITPEVMNAHSALTHAIEGNRVVLASDCRVMLVNALRATGKLEE